MIHYKTPEEIELIRQSCLLVCKALAHVASILKPGMTGEQLDAAAEEVIRDHGAVPGFKGYRGFPATLCISPNEAVVHGIPSKQVIKDGDILSVDCGVYMNEYYGDSAYTFAVGEINDEVRRLLEVTNTSLYRAIDKAIIGNRLGDIGYAVQEYVERKHKFGVVRELVGHGIGRNLHEAPEVPNYGKRGWGTRLQEGLVIAIEPMVNLGSRNVKHAQDGWTVISRDHKSSAHFEHTVAVGADRADILSDHSLIEVEIDKNDNIWKVGILDAEPVK